MSIKDNVLAIKKKIPKDIVIEAATKTRSVGEVEEAVSAGINVIGENYVQEAEAKFDLLKGKVKIHCIGHLQTNKVKKAVSVFDMIETVDSEKIAKEIDKKSGEVGKVMPVLVEVNSGEEENKDGVMPSSAVSLIRKISVLENIKVKGLMTMAPYSDDSEKDRPYFKLVKNMFDEVKSMDIPNVDMEILSMGMSHSYKVAVSEGANMVRIGTGIFGKRK